VTWLWPIRRVTKCTLVNAFPIDNAANLIRRHLFTCKRVKKQCSRTAWRKIKGIRLFLSLEFKLKEDKLSGFGNWTHFTNILHESIDSLGYITSTNGKLNYTWTSSSQETSRKMRRSQNTYHCFGQRKYFYSRNSHSVEEAG
jgi:hypothetical protein